MLNHLKHKILAIGSPTMFRRLSSKIDQGRFSLTACEHPSEALILLEQEPFDMVIVDILVKNARTVCQGAQAGNGIPVALLLQEKPVNWRALGELAVDGFLADGGTNAEFMARLSAYIRRKPKAFRCV